MKALLLAASLCSAACASAPAQPHDARDPTRCDPRGAAARSGVPDRCQAQAAMERVKPAIEHCSEIRGVVFATVHFSSDGAATAVEVEGGGYPDATLACVEQAAMQARIQPFRAATFLIKFPFRLGQR